MAVFGGLTARVLVESEWVVPLARFRVTGTCDGAAFVLEWHAWPPLWLEWQSDPAPR